MKKSNARSARGRLPPLVLLSLIVAALVGEVFLRVFYPCPRYNYAYQPPQQTFFRYDSLLGWKGRPGADGTFASLDFIVRVTHDRHGHRSSTDPTLPGKRNVIVVGDSYGWGWGVDNDDVFAEVMMRETGWNVYNLSAPGYGTDQQLLEIDLLTRRPTPGPEADVGVLLFTKNDFLDITSEERYGYPKPRFLFDGAEPLLSNVPVPERETSVYDSARSLERYKRTWFNNSHLYNFVIEVCRKVLRTLGIGPPAAVDPDRAVEAEDVRAAAQLIQMMRDEFAERGTDFYVILMMPDNDRCWDDLESKLARMGIAASRFNDRVFYRQTRLWLDRHLNAFGHRRLAAAVTATVRKSFADES
ncbi:MAG: hypothetical protein O7D32_08850 [bacterium]|nr:hypothetical protein [bacterium]